LPYLVIDALARAIGKRYSTFDVVGAGPRVVAGILEDFEETALLPCESVISNIELVKKFDAIFISAMSSDYEALRRLVMKIKEARFRGPIVVGGPISFEYSRVLSELPVDFVVIGEAEIPLKYLVNCFKSKGDESCLEKTPALAFREKGKIKLTSRHIHTPKEMLSTIKPWTKIDLSYKPTWIYRFYVEVLRGCSNFFRPLVGSGELNCLLCMKCRSPNLSERLSCPANIPPGCGFCSVPYMFGYPRSRSVRSIVNEVEELVVHGARRIVLSAPDFLDYCREELVEGVLTDPCNPPPNVNVIEDLLNALFSIEDVKSGKVAIMIENIKACLVNEEIGKVLGKYLKDTTVHIGLETGCDWYNDRVLGKPIGLNHVLRACRILSEAGLRPYVYLMHDLPLAGREVYLNTMKAIEALGRVGVEKITFYKYTKLPATAFEKISEQQEEEDVSEIIREIKKLISKYNTAMKRHLIGKRVEVYIVKSSSGYYGYPVKHGPVVVISSRSTPYREISGCKGVVKITDISSRAVRGELISVLECPQNT